MSDDREHYPIPPRLRALIEKARQDHMRAVREMTTRLEKMDAYDYAAEFSVEVLGDDAEAISGCRLCTIQFEPAKYDGAVRLYRHHGESYIPHEQVVAAFKDKSDPGRPERHYSGDASTEFWNRVNALPRPVRDELYSCGVLLQDMEDKVTRWLHEAEIKATAQSKEPG